MPATKTRRRTAKKKTSPRMIYAFGRTKTDGDASQKMLLGGKGANLAEMTSIGIPVPPGFTITTTTCAAYNDRGNRLPVGLMAQVKTAIGRLERETGKFFGSTTDPAPRERAKWRCSFDAGHDGNSAQPWPQR